MGADDKLSNAAQEFKGNAKEKVGDATDNERLRSEGVADQAGGRAQQAVGDMKNAVNDATR